MRKTLLWLLAIIITLSSAIYQRQTGPTYPWSGQVSFFGEEIKFSLPRSADNTDNCQVVVELPERLTGQVQGFLQFKKYKTDGPWNILAMKQEGNRLIGYLPKQPAAGKLEYLVHLVSGSQEISLTGEEPVIIRFKGPVSDSILLAHVVVMFLAMLLAIRAGLAAINRQEDPTPLARWAAILFFIGGFALGAVVQKMAFGVFWSGFPLGTDLTDTKTLIAMLAWIAALASGRKTRPKRGWVLAASIITLIIYLIPHSIFGS
ncbi:MAG: hypothetical protein PHQ25_09045 [Acidobacteriota bacterium]|nr:hypothetical protein [Acidobacteriota bacterium]MDW3229612.1 hypothetical protein [Acidobacteriota bacterium]MDY0232283.1 hypothetical protein [Candidatus Saccharicenans sp.]